MKYIQFSFSNGTTWQIAAEKIAQDRARYYAICAEARAENYDIIYKEELDWALGHYEEIIDWLENNMNWEDIVEDVKLVKTEPIKVDYEKEFANCKKEVVEP